MRLKELLKCVTVDAVRYKNYKRRDQLPFVEDEDFSVPPGEKQSSTWTDFSLTDALMLQVMNNLSEHKSPPGVGRTTDSQRYDGLPPLSASTIASNGVNKALGKFDGLSGLINGRKDIWVLKIVEQHEDEGQLCNTGEHFAGTMADCAKKLEQTSKHQVRAILVNVSQALNGILRRGKAEKVTEVVEFIGQTDE